MSEVSLINFLDVLTSRVIFEDGVYGPFRNQDGELGLISSSPDGRGLSWISADGISAENFGAFLEAVINWQQALNDSTVSFDQVLILQQKVEAFR